MAPQTVDGGETIKLAHTTGGPQISGGKGDSGPPFWFQRDGRWKEGTSKLEEEERVPVQAKAREPTRMSNIPTSSQEGDSILFEIMRRIEAAKRYPKVARRMGIEGKTAVRFKLKPNGKVESVEVMESSGADILDQASLETVRRAVPLPYKEGWLKVVIVFKIL